MDIILAGVRPNLLHLKTITVIPLETAYTDIVICQLKLSERNSLLSWSVD